MNNQKMPMLPQDNEGIKKEGEVKETKKTSKPKKN